MQNRVASIDGFSGNYRRGQPRKVQHGYNVSDVVRDILWDLKEERGWGNAELGQFIGVAGSSIQRFLCGMAPDNRGKYEDADLRIAFLTKACAALAETPLQFLQRHPVYGKSPSPVASILSAEALELLRLAEMAKHAGVFELWREQLDLALKFVGDKPVPKARKRVTA
jgi:hypothetical protein